MIVNVSKAKSELSELIDKVARGEEVIIMKNNRPLVELVIHKQKNKRPLGLLAGKINIPDDFLEENEEINALFYGDKM